MKYFSSLFLLCVIVACTKESFPDGESRYQSFSPDGIEFRVADSVWNEDLRGNHRAVVAAADDKSDAVIVDLPWRRPDLRIETKKIVVTDINDHEINNVVVTEMTNEKGQILFEPVEGVKEYFVYYLPFNFRHGYNDARYGEPWNDYLKPEYQADSAWAEAAVSSINTLPKAQVRCFESRTKFNFWTPMGLIATKEETERIKNSCTSEMIIFPEDRAFPIQLRNNLPAKWNKVPERRFEGCAQRNEYYVWQLGVWAATRDLNNIKVSFSDLKNGNDVIPSSEITCFNQEGTNWDGNHIEFNINVPESKVQALWCGVQIPEGAKAGSYYGTATVSADDVESQNIELCIKVSSELIEDKGDSELWRHARLRWLNSTLCLDNEPVAPFKELSISNNRIEATGKSVVIGNNGMVSSIVTNNREILVEPQTFVVSTSEGDITYTADNLEFNKEAAGLISWKSSSQEKGIRFSLYGNIEFDGHLHYEISVSADEEIDVKDIKLITNYSPSASEYFMGCGTKGGNRPEKYTWDWTGPYDSYWIGSAFAGLQTEFRGGAYHGPLLNDYKPAPTPVWSNDGLGKVTVNGNKGKNCIVTASTGKNSLTSAAKTFEYNLLITPVKELNTSQHFKEKYFHSDPKEYDKAAEDGCNVMNIHHAGVLNPYINYPFIVRDSLTEFITHEHENGRKVKLYYTIRELSTLCEEIYAFHSLNHEIFTTGVGYGLPWECEHLIDDYKPAWYTSNEGMQNFEPDAALVLTPNSRFINYWLEGLKWMMQNYDIDGIYMDDVSFDRTTVKRIRKILERYHQGALIDLHSNTAYSIGPANQYLEFIPYVNRLWFGESFRYNEMSADEWLVTFSGIPYGEMAEMLQDGGNRYLGMVYGATARHAWMSADNVKSPVPVWKLWDKFGISESRMVGYWDSECAVQTSDPDVKATTYVKKDSVLISIGNFGNADKTVKLSIDWHKLGMDPSTAKIEAPAILNFQDQTNFTDGQAIHIKSKEGWLLTISQ